MTNHATSAPGASPALLVAAGAFAIAIFAIDTFTLLDIAIAVLYVVVVLAAANVFHRRGVLLVSTGCLTLTVASFLLSHGFHANTALVRSLVSMAAIVITTFLALKNQAATLSLREQAQLLDLTHDAIFVRGMNDVITYWNRGAQELYGWSSDQAIGQVTHELLKTVFPVSLDSINADLIRMERWEGELVHTKRDGKQVMVSSRWSLRRDDRGQPTSVLETNTDITERNQAQEALHQAQAELAHVTRVTTLGELTASIAHEVNQPLTAIVTNGEACLRWLGRDVPDMDESRGAVERMIREARRASQVVARLRALAKKVDPEMAALDVNDVINEVVLLVQREITSHRVSLRLDLASSLPTVRGDRVQLQQVIINLMMNGIQAMAAVRDHRRELVIRSRAHEVDQILVSVQDNGIGIDAENENLLFKAFFTTKPEGMGMGLSICRSIIDAHGGRIWAAANRSPGATFQFTLPTIREAEPPAA
jgi:two-component system sensor kinase FixL